MTLWGDTAQNFCAQEGTIVGIKGAFVKEFNGSYNLSINAASRMEFDPECEETEDLRQWYETERATTEVKALSTQGTGSGGNFVEEARALAVYTDPSVFVHYERGIYFNSVAMITAIRQENAVYQACPTPGCQKKVQEADGQYRCEKCYKNFPDFKYRFMVSVEISDCVSTGWITLFDDRAEPFFGKSAQEMGDLKNNSVSF